MSRRQWADRADEVGNLRSESLRLLDELRAWWPQSNGVRSIGIAGGSLHLDFLRDCLAGEGPLVVIDPEDREQMNTVALAIFGKGAVCTQADRLQDIFRDLADPKPPKPQEPTGLGAVVRAADQGVWIRVTTDVVKPWVMHRQTRFYADIDAVEVLSQGVIA